MCVCLNGTRYERQPGRELEPVDTPAEFEK
jgi:hypothetical protein